MSVSARSTVPRRRLNGMPIRFSPECFVDSTPGEIVEFVVRCNVATSFFAHTAWAQFITQHQHTTAQHLPLLLLPLAAAPMSKAHPSPTPPPPPPPPTFSSLFSHRPWRRFDETLRARRHHRRRRREVGDSTTSFVTEIAPPHRRRHCRQDRRRRREKSPSPAPGFHLATTPDDVADDSMNAMRPAVLAPG